jgi:hypothetical protein
MHPIRFAIIRNKARAESLRIERIGAARDFIVGWAAGLIFFGTMLS